VHHAERGVDISAVQQVDLPTRDVLVVYDSSGDRQFVGFGGPNESFADTAISADALPLDALQSAAALVTGTLGLSFPVTAAAMHKAVEAAKSGGAVVRPQDHCKQTLSGIVLVQFDAASLIHWCLNRCWWI
jgi:fructokinase